VSFSIQTNITSLQAQNNLATSAAFQSQTINEVTSGLRIVNSGDDAAGLAIANALGSDQAVLTQGIQNANNGLATLQTIDGGINNVTTLLDRAATLAAQSASGTFTGSRATLNSEFQSVVSEISQEAQSIGLNAGGQFAKSLSVFVGGGQAGNGVTAVQNGSVGVDLLKFESRQARLCEGAEHVGEPIVVPRGIAEADLIQLRALHEEVHVVLPREPDAAVDLKSRSHDPGGRLRAPDLGGRCS
jgi:flagellin-like hook-associated protein FlgL